MLPSSVDSNCTYVNPVIVTAWFVRFYISLLSTRVPTIPNVVYCVPPTRQVETGVSPLPN
jgi:hypothetical protein